MSPTARTLHHLRQLGYRADKVEQTIPKCFIKRDLFGIGDELAMKAGESLLLIQATVTAKLTARMRKDPETVAQWVSTGNQFQYGGWAKRGKKGARKTWHLTVRTIP